MKNRGQRIVNLTFPLSERYVLYICATILMADYKTDKPGQSPFIHNIPNSNNLSVKTVKKYYPFLMSGHPPIFSLFSKEHYLI